MVQRSWAWVATIWWEQEVLDLASARAAVEVEEDREEGIEEEEEDE